MQEYSTLQGLISDCNDRPDIFLLQEHWLTPANLFKFDKYFSDYLSFGSSAMASCVEAVCYAAVLLEAFYYHTLAR